VQIGQVGQLQGVGEVVVVQNQRVQVGKLLEPLQRRDAVVAEVEALHPGAVQLRQHRRNPLAVLTHIAQLRKLKGILRYVGSIMIYRKVRISEPLEN
jgi:hypothetical protein